jgi:lipopolysaccharide export system permease protein
VRFGILQRYVLGEVFRAFFMALLTITIVFVLFIVMTMGTQFSLAPREMLHLIPYAIPGSMPYTVPVSLLFAVTVVFGRLAGDNEIIAIKTAGLSAWTVLRPALGFGLVLSVAMMVASSGPIPTANEMMKKVFYKSSEDIFYKFLKRDREFNRADWPFSIKVKDVRDRVLIEPTFKHRAEKPPAGQQPAPPKAGEPLEEPVFFDQVVQAKEATITFDLEHDEAHVHLDGADIQQSSGGDGRSMVFNDTEFILPLSPDFKKTMPKRINEVTDAEMVVEQRKFRALITNERKRQSAAAAMFIASGRVEMVNWVEFQGAFTDYATWQQVWNSFETERRQRTAMAWGSLFFVLLGAPVGIRFARRDFLSAFITCFVPIILIYYPLMMGGANLSRGGFINPLYSLWAGNAVLLVLTGLVLRPVLKH